MALLKSERTCRWLADSIAAARLELAFDVWAYVFMPEHVHLIVHPQRADYDISSIRRAIKEPVGRRAIAYLRKHSRESLARLSRIRGKRHEHLFWQSGGGYDRNITSTKSLLSMIDYLHLNPVRRGLVAQASQWQWLSAAWFEYSGPSPVQVDVIDSAWLSQDA
jgi:putative transposase